MFTNCFPIYIQFIESIILSNISTVSQDSSLIENVAIIATEGGIKHDDFLITFPI